MKTTLVFAGVAAVVAAGLFLMRSQPESLIVPEAPEQSALGEGEAMLARVPSAFVPNVGQWEHQARFVAGIGAASVFIEEGGFLVSVAEAAVVPGLGAAVRMRFEGARSSEIVGEEPLAGVHNYFLGDHPSRWRTEVPRYGAVRYRGPWPGVEVVCYEKEGHLEYDVALEPGADLAQVEFVVEGGSALRIDGEGSLLVETAAGPLRQARPATYEMDGAGARRELVARYELRGEDRFGFVVTEWDGKEALVLDPGLLWSTFVGGGDLDEAHALSVDASGVVTISGRTASSDYPTTAGAWDTSHNSGANFDAFVTRLDPSLPAAQQLLYSTFVGGGSIDEATALSVDAAGIVTIAGFTFSTNYPTTPGAWDTSSNGVDVFVTRLDPSLPAAQQLLYSTFVGVVPSFLWLSLWVEPAGIVTIAGRTDSPTFPITAGAWDTSHNGGEDVFVTRLDPSLPAAQQVLYSTFVGGAGTDRPHAVSIDATGVVILAGFTSSLDYPTTLGAFDTTYDGSIDACVTRLDPSLPAGQQLLYSSFVGGAQQDQAHALSVDAAGVVTITGFTGSPTYPTTVGAWDTSFNGGDAFVMRLDLSLPAAQQLLYSTFVGQTSTAERNSLSVDPAGIVTIAGWAFSTNYPTTAGAWDTSFNGGDAFVTRLDPSLPAAQQLLYSTMVGGNSIERATAISVDATSIVMIAG